MVMLIMLYKVVLTFEFVNEILKCGNMKVIPRAVFSYIAISSLPFFNLIIFSLNTVQRLQSQVSISL